MNLHLFTIPLSSHDLLSFPFFLFFNLILHTTPTFPDKRNILRSSNNSTFNSIHRRITYIHSQKKKNTRLTFSSPRKFLDLRHPRSEPRLSSRRVNLFVYTSRSRTFSLALVGVNERTFRENGPSGPEDGEGDGPRLLASIGPFTSSFFFFSLPFLFSFFHGGTKGQPRRLSKSHVRRLDRVALVRNNHESGAGSALGSSGQPRLIVLEWFGPDARSTDRQRVREIPISWDGKIVFFF